MTTPGSPPSAADLRATFARGDPYTVGFEEELMLLAPDTLELVHNAPEVIRHLNGDPRFKLELPASQLEIVTPPRQGVNDAAGELLAARRDLACATDGLVRLAGA